MYARATSGDKPNNNKFSICSVRNISAVLKKKKDDCFVGKFSLLSLSVSDIDSCPHAFTSSICTCTQNLDSQYVEMDLWKLRSSATVATVTSAKTPAAIMPMKRRTKSANFSPVNCAGQM